MFINSFIPWNADLSEFQKNLQFLYKCGYQGAFVNVSDSKQYKEFIDSEFFPKKRPEISFPIEISSLNAYKKDSSPIVLFPRITLEPANIQALKQELNQWVSRRCVIGVQSNSKEILEVAARDGRVDMITLPSLLYLKDLSKGILSLLKQNGIYLDIHYNELITSYGSKRTRILRNLYKLFKQAKPFSYKYIIGTGQHPSKKQVEFLRGPREIGAIFISLLDLPEKHVKSILRENIEALALLFVKRDQHVFIQPGVEIINKE